MPLPGVQVRSRVLFAPGSRFPKGQPPALLLPADVRALKRRRRGQPIAEPVQGAWEARVARAERLPPSYACELVVTGRVAGRGLAAVAWLGWRLLS